MKINLERLEVLKRTLGGNEPNYDYSDPIGLQIIMEAVRHYLFDSQHENIVIVKFLTDYGVLVVDDEVKKEKPIVSPHNFGE